MKKLLLGVLASAVLSNAAIADVPGVITSKQTLAPVSFFLDKTNDVLSVTNQTNHSFVVQVSVANTTDVQGNPSGGVNVQNCGSVTHISPGSSALCNLLVGSDSVMLNFDGSTTFATGSYQLLKVIQ